MTVAEAPLAAVPQIEGANFLNILIVDDERSIRDACREVAQSLGFTALRGFRRACLSCAGITRH